MDAHALPGAEEYAAMACVQRAPVPAVGLGLQGAEGGRRHEAGHVVVVAEHPQHRGPAVELAEAGVGDDEAPAPADERGADEVRGLVRRQADEHLLQEVIRQRPRHGAVARPGSEPGAAAELGFCAAAGGRRGESMGVLDT